MVSLFVPGVPRTTQTGSSITVNGRTFPLRRNTAWANLFEIYAREQAPKSPLEGAVACEVTFIMPRPKKKRNHPCVRPDAENLWKGLGDKLNGILWHDDAQVCRLGLFKRYQAGPDEAPGVHILADTMEGQCQP